MKLSGIWLNLIGIILEDKNLNFDNVINRNHLETPSHSADYVICERPIIKRYEDKQYLNINHEFNGLLLSSVDEGKGYWCLLLTFEHRMSFAR